MKISKELLTQIVICVFLSIGVIVCSKITVDTIQKIYDVGFDEMADLISTKGSAAVASMIPTPFSHPEMEVVTKGDVVAIGKAHIKLNGTLIEQTESNVKYKVSKSKGTSTLYINHYTKGSDQLILAVSKFMQGDVNAVMSMAGVEYNIDNLEPKQQTTPDGVFPFIYDKASKNYFVFYAYGKGYYVLYSDQPFNMTTEMLTAKYPGPGEDPLRYHEYSTYEIQAVENTRAELTNGEYQQFEITPNELTVDPGATGYNSKTANTMRADMIAKTGLDWNADGTSEESDSTVDITSSTAVASKWVVGDETYLFTNQGLTISDLTYKANSQHLEISGKVTNTLPSERPYVLLVKFLDSEDNLLDVEGTDSRDEPIAANNSTVFSIDVPNTKVNPKDVKALMFEVY